MKYYALFLLLLSTSTCRTAPTPAVDNLVAFGKLYGYVKYFHPNNAPQDFAWDKFAIYGAEQIMAASDTAEAVKILQRLFRPIAPSVLIAESIEALAYYPKLDPLDKYDSFTFWQHRGLGFGMFGPSKAYASSRVFSENGKLNNELFNLVPDINEKITEQLAPGISCEVPLVLPTHLSDLGNTKVLEQALEDYKIDMTRPACRLGNIVNVYNVLQHFYPYFDVVDVDWQMEFRKALQQSYADHDQYDHYRTLQLMTATLKDGHMMVLKRDHPQYYPPFYWEWIEDRLVITATMEEAESLQIGDIVTHVDGRPAAEYLADFAPVVSAGTEGRLRYRIQHTSLLGPPDAPITITVAGKDLKFQRTILLNADYLGITPTTRKHRVYADSIHYLHLGNTSMAEIIELIPELATAKGIVCDLRTRPNGNHEFLRHLMTIQDTSSSWMQIPQFLYPNQQGLITFDKRNWIPTMKPKAPYLGDCPVVFLTNERAISYAESYLGFVKGYGLATIIGSPTAGTNGNINRFVLPGDYAIIFTGMKVVQHDGSQLHGVGIQPDIFVRTTIEGVQQGRDEVLERALDFFVNGK